MLTVAPLQNTAAKSPLVGKSPHAGLLLQRKCACGGSASASLSGECEECNKNHLQKKLSIGASNDPLEQEADRVADQVLAAPAHPAVSGVPPRIQRFTGQSSGHTDTAPASVDRVLASSSRSLDPALQQDMGQRFGHDFSQVRVHTGKAAEQSARDVNAHAYTVGNNVVFGAGRYTFGTNEGRRLLAHELTHVVQQSAVPRIIQRAINVDNFEGGSFTMGVLETYLANFGPGKIEDHNDSDDKARTIVALWRQGKIKLDVSKKILLIQEMQSGFTGDDDERAILTLLLNITDVELQTIFGKGGIDPNDLDGDFQGPEEDVLRAFYDRKCEGGRAVALKGSCKIRAAAAAGQQAAPKAEKQPPARVPRKKETDVVVLLDATLTPVVKTIASDAVVLQPATPEELGKQLKALNRPIKTIFYFGHADDSAAIKFGKGWVTAEKHAAAVNGMVPSGMEPELVDFRGCRIGMTPPAMEKIRAALGAKAAIGGTCWLITKIVGPFDLGDGDVVSPTRPKRYTNAQLAPGIKMALDSFGPATKCVIDTTTAAYFRAGGKFVSAWFSPRRATEFDPLYSRCYNSLEPKVVDPAVVAKAQASTSHDCQLIRVEEKPKAEAKP